MLQYMLRYGICVDIEVCYMLRMEFVVTQKDVTCYVMGSVVELHTCDVLRCGICADIERCYKLFYGIRAHEKTDVTCYVTQFVLT